MQPIIELLRREPRTRIFLAVHAQSSVGTGAGYAALILLAYDRLHSPLAISLVLGADLLPAMVLGPLFGAAADRWSRRRCAVAAEILRAAAFAGLALVDGIAATVALALLAGAGTALFTPAAMASLPGLVERRRLAAANGLFAAIADFGQALGPAIAAGVLLAVGPSTLVLGNAATFAISAVVLARLPFGRVGRRLDRKRRSLIHEAREGVRVARRLRGVRVVLAASSGVLLFAGMFNVAELPYASQSLDAGPSGFSALLAAFALGVVAGSLAGASGGRDGVLERRYVAGLLIVAAGFAAAAVAPGLLSALVVFTVAGVGNGLVVVHERVLIQRRAPDPVLGRVFGVRDALTAWAFATAFAVGAPAVVLLGPRGTLLLAAVGAAVAATLAALALGRAPGLREPPARAVPGSA